MFSKVFICFVIILIGIGLFVYVQIRDRYDSRIPFLFRFVRYLSEEIAILGYVKILRKVKERVFTPTNLSTHHFYQDSIQFIDDQFFVNDIFRIDVNVYEPFQIDDETSIFLFFHGSGFALSHPNFYHLLAKMLFEERKMNMIGVFPNYRKSPEFKRKSIFLDAIKSLEFVIQKYGRNRKLIIAGDSAGGSIAISLSRYLRDNHYEMYEKPKILVALFYPWLCFLEPMHPELEDSKCPVAYDPKLMNKGTMRYLTSLMKYSTDPSFDEEKVHNFFDNLEGLPNTMIFAAENDILGREGVYFGNLMKNVNPKNQVMLLEDETHGFVIRLKESWGKVLDRLVLFFEKYY